MVAAHHEKWDGSGYPRGKAGEEIPLEARIFAIAEGYDALTSRRPYKPPLSFDATMRILEDGRGCHFDPALIDLFRGLAPGIHAQVNGLGESEVRALMERVVRRHFGIAAA